MNDQQHSNMVQQITGQVRSMFYLVDEPTTMLTIQTDGQLLTARASGQLALDLRSLPRGATISVMLRAVPNEIRIIAFTVMSTG
jgi:hypothetical protein